MLAPSLTVDDVAARCGVQVITVRKWIRLGMIPSYRLGGARRFDPVEVDRWIASHHEPVR